MTALSPRARQALADYRKSTRTDLEARSALLGRVQASIAAGTDEVLLAELDAPRKSAAAGWTHQLRWAAVGAAAATVVFWGGLQLAGVSVFPAPVTPGPQAAVYGSSQGDARPVEPPTVRPRPADSATSTEAAPPSAPEPSAADSDAEPASSRRRPTLAPPTATPAAEHEPSTLADELRLMQTARAALQRGDTAAALATLATHAKRFEHGQLREDRLALHVVALCRAGQTRAGEAAQRSFRSAFPASHHLVQVSAACTGKGTAAGDGSAPSRELPR